MLFWRKNFEAGPCPTTGLLFVYQNFALFFFKGSSVLTNISVANLAEIPAAKHNFGLRKISAVEKICNQNFSSAAKFFSYSGRKYLPGVGNNDRRKQ
jgi:hypothetical protein